MERVKLFERYLYLAQEIHNLPLFNTIPRINHIITKALQSNPAWGATLEPMINRYQTAMVQTVSLTLSRNIQQDPATMVSMWTQYATDETTMLNTVLDLVNFRDICNIPLSDLKWNAYGLYIPKEIQDFWSIVTAVQFLMPIVAAAQKRYVEVYNQNLSFSIMLCITKNFLNNLYPQGWEFINKKIYHAASGKVENIEEFLAQVILTGLGDLELESTKYIDMLDIEHVMDVVLAKFVPSTVPQTNMY